MKNIHPFIRTAAISAMVFMFLHNLMVGPMPQSICLLTSIVLLTYIISFLVQYVKEKRGGEK